jgi:hypothetical protein
MPDGPSYVLYRRDVKMIVYANGQKEVFADESQTAKVPEETPRQPDKKDEVGTKPASAEKTKPVTTDQADYYGGGHTYAPGNEINCKGGSTYFYQNKKIKEKQAYTMMNETGDKQIIGLIGKAKDKHKLQYIGYAAFPLSLISFVTYSSAITYYPAVPGSGARPQVKSINHGQQDVALGIAALAIACPVISVKAKFDRKKYNKQAVKLYNEKF